MKATILQGDLNKWLGIAARVVPTRVQLPVLSNLLIEVKKPGIFISATNLEIGLRVAAGGKAEEEGAVTIPAKNFEEFVGSLPPENVTVETEGDKIRVTGGSVSAIFSGIPAAEFPVITGTEETKIEGKMMPIKRQLVEEIAREVAFCAATDESRPVLTGVRFVAEGKKLKVTATDGFRLSQKTYQTEEEMPGMEKGVILPARTIFEAGKILETGKQGFLEMGVVKGGSQIILGCGGVEMTSRVLEGTYPEVEKIIPKEWKCETVVDKEELVRAVRVAGIFARDSANVVKLTVGIGEMAVESSSAQTGESKTGIEAVTSGGETKISFNYRYVLDFLGSVSGERIRIRLGDGMTAGIFGVEGDDQLIHLIMPVRV